MLIKISYNFFHNNLFDLHEGQHTIQYVTFLILFDNFSICLELPPKVFVLVLETINIVILQKKLQNCNYNSDSKLQFIQSY